MSSNASKRILIAPLDWGLGHTSRCVPIIESLLVNGHQALFAGNEWQRSFIVQTFPGIETIHLDGYNVTYSRHAFSFMFAIMKQMPGLIQIVKKENGWLKSLVRSQKIDGIISDNRYGLYHQGIPSVIMTHQLMALSGMGRLSDNMLQRFHYGYIQKFGKCWVVDVQGEPNLSGKLGHPERLPDNAAYLGLLSQFSKQERKSDGDYLLVLLSGPEPQRTFLSEKLWAQILQYEGKAVFVEGSNAVKEPTSIPAHITYYKQLTREQLTPILNGASLVICRSGYSTLMDLVMLDKNAVLIPTPGQTEQEYLARHLHGSGVFLSGSQKNFVLDKALKEAKSFPFVKLVLNDGFKQYERSLADWVNKL